MILIVGGAGYIGSHVVKRLNSNGYKTVVFDNLSLGHEEFVKWGTFIKGELSSKEDIETCFKKYAIHAVMHFSAFANVGESLKNPLKYYQNNVANTLNLLEIMEKYKVKEFIFSSTCATYGNPTTEKLSEDHPQNPINPYGQSKLMIEKIIKDISKTKSLNYMFLRYFNAAGADLDGEIGELHNPETHLIPIAINATLEKRAPLTVFGDDYPTNDGSCIRDYIHVNDLADAHILALEQLKETKKCNEFNLGNGKGYSVFEIIKKVTDITGKKVPYNIGERRDGDPAKLIADNQKAKNVLKWEPKLNSLDIIIDSAYQFLKKYG